jgi:hypothetical protein
MGRIGLRGLLEADKRPEGEGSPGADWGRRGERAEPEKPRVTNVICKS